MNDEAKKEVINAIEHALFNEEITIEVYESIHNSLINGESDIVTIKLDSANNSYFILS